MRPAKQELTAERSRELLSCDPETCVFLWEGDRGSARVGEVAGSKDRKGHIGIVIDGRRYMAHRLVRLYFRGKWPEPGYDTDHINLDKADNRLCNLRHATRSQNQANTLAQANNKSGLKGASFHKPIGKWQAQIMVEGKKLRLGYFKTKFRSIRESGMSRHGRLKEKSNDNTQATKRGYHANLNGEGRWPGGGCDPSRFANAT